MRLSQVRVLQRGGQRTLRSVALVVACSVVFPATLAAQATVDRRDDNNGVPMRPGTVAVVPFVNISGQPSDDWIGSGIAETVPADLQRVGALSVIGREVFLEEARKQGSDLSVSGDDGERVAREFGQALGVGWLVSGGYQRLGDRLRVTARVIDVATGAVSASVKQVWQATDTQLNRQVALKILPGVEVGLVRAVE